MKEIIEDDPRLGAGGNFPPPPTPFEVAKERIDGLYGEAKLWLDGDTVDTPEMADGLAHLLDELRKAEKAADKARDDEKRPHLLAGRAVDDAYRPILATASRGIAVCKAALQPWLERLETEQRAKAAAEREAAQAALAEAQAAIRGADRANLAAIEEAEALLVKAKRQDAGASKAERASPKVGAIGRSVSLRTTYTPVMTDPMAALKHYRLTEPEAMKEFLQSLAVRDVRAGKRSIPGFDVAEVKSAV